MFMLVSLNDLAGKLLADSRSARLRAAKKFADLGHGSAQFAGRDGCRHKRRGGVTLSRDFCYCPCVTALLGGRYRDFSHVSGAKRKQPREAGDTFKHGGECEARNQVGMRYWQTELRQRTSDRVSHRCGALGGGAVLRGLGALRFGCFDAESIKTGGQGRALNPNRRASVTSPAFRDPGQSRYSLSPVGGDLGQVATLGHDHRYRRGAQLARMLLRHHEEDRVAVAGGRCRLASRSDGAHAATPVICFS
ncbi:hypothetical protein [Paraburkholderia panacisoli]|uniref:hypothetical protein n=1 Tax=Paraburkholderia panacisoli TaxID=2603818 RepID=UPI00165FD5CC|nr:hypothetical protein [Paraburkholderia panacisoli]